MRRGLSLFVQEENGGETSRALKSSEGYEDFSPIHQKPGAKKRVWFFQKRSLSEAEKKFQALAESILIYPELSLLLLCLAVCLLTLIADIKNKMSQWKIAFEASIIIFQIISMLLLWKWKSLIIYVNYINLLLMTFFFVETVLLKSEQPNQVKHTFFAGYIFFGISALHFYIDRNPFRKSLFFLAHILITLGRFSLFSPWWASSGLILILIISQWFSFNIEVLWGRTSKKLRQKSGQVRAWKHINERVLPNGYVVFQPVNYQKMESFFRRITKSTGNIASDKANEKEIIINPSVSEWASHIKILMVNKTGRDLLGTDDPGELMRLFSETPISDMNNDFKFSEDLEMQLSCLAVAKSDREIDDKGGSEANSQRNLLIKVAECFVKMKKDSEKNRKLLRNQSVIMDHIINQPIKFKNKEKPMYFDISFSVFMWKGQYSLLMVISDISEKVLNQREKEIQEFQDELISSVSHELRTPLNTIIGTLSYLEARCRDPQLMMDISQIQMSCEMLLSRINDILDYAQSLKKKRLEVEANVFTVEDLVRPLLRIFQRQAEEKKMKLSLLIDPPLRQTTLSTDLCRLKQVLINLLTNAVKFTFKGEISLVIKRIDDSQMLFEIKDTGIGMSKEGIANLFRVQKKAGTDLKENGIGFGLTISNYIVGHLGPKEEIKVESILNQGSKFSFLIYDTLRPFKQRRREKTFQPHAAGIRDSADSSILQSWFSIGNERARSNNRQFTLMPIQFMNVRHLIPSQLSLSMEEGSVIMTNENEQNNPKFIEPRLLSERMSKTRSKSIDCAERPDFRSQQIKINEGNFELKIVKGNSAENDTPSFNYGSSGEKRSTDDLVLESKFAKNFRQINISSVEEMKENEHGSGELAIAETVETKRTVHVMIVDDTPFNLILLEKFLSEIAEFKLMVSKAYNGKEAVDKAEKASPPVDIFFMDCNMPILDGYEATKILKKKMGEGILKSAPVLAITALSGKENEKKCYDSLMDAFISKPVTRQQFTDIFRKWVNKEPVFY